VGAYTAYVRGAIIARERSAVAHSPSAGTGYLPGWLVSAAQYILDHLGPQSALR